MAALKYAQKESLRNAIKTYKSKRKQINCDVDLDYYENVLKPFAQKQGKTCPALMKEAVLVYMSEHLNDENEPVMSDEDMLCEKIDTIERELVAVKKLAHKIRQEKMRDIQKQ